MKKKQQQPPRQNQNPHARTPQQIEADRARIAEMYRKGVSMYRMGKVIGISTKLVSITIAKIKKELLAKMDRAMEEWLAEELDKLDYIEKEAWEAWERSQQDAEMVETTDRVVRAIQGKGHGVPRGTRPPKATKTVLMRKEGQVGDARFLMVAKDCVAKRAELLGLAGFRRQQDQEPYQMQDAIRSRISQRLQALAPPSQPAADPGQETVQ